MKKFLTSTPWRILALTGLGVCVGLLSLILSAVAYLPLDAGELFDSYFHANPTVAAVNCLAPVALIWLGWFLTRRGWAAYLLACAPCLAVSVVNYYKISLRSDPLLAADLLLFSEAGNIVEGYDLTLPPVVLLCLGCAAAGLLGALLLLPKSRMALPERLFGLFSSAAVVMCLFFGVYLDTAFEKQMKNDAFINPWSDVEVFVSRGTLYSFLHSARDMYYAPPEGYKESAGREIFEGLTDAHIPEEKKVSVMAVMLEAFVDLTDFPALAGEPGVQGVYEPWHELEERSVYGELLTNIFAGGTVDSEWGFLTGYSRHADFRIPTDSYVWYLRNEGYRTAFDHPGHSWFYNRQNVNEYLGFHASRFTEDFYGKLVDPVAAAWNSDKIFFPELLAQLENEKNPMFSFSVTYQNHGPYESAGFDGEPWVTCLDAESNNIFNHYLRGIEKTLTAVTDTVQKLEQTQEPVVLVLFGDHKPWAGNGNSAYLAAGVTFDTSTLGGFYDYYSTPYLIWANDAAKETLGQEFTGHGGDFSPCFLMAELFDQCGWEGPGVMQLQREVREVTPMLHERGLYLVEGQLTDTLGEEDKEIVDAYRWAEYYREQKHIT